MKVTKSHEAPPGPVDASHFDGSVTRQDYGEIPSPEGSALLVSFPAGARTHWHSHPDGQVLFVVDGIGRVGVRDAPAIEIRTGDVATPCRARSTGTAPRRRRRCDIWRCPSAPRSGWGGSTTDAQVR